MSNRVPLEAIILALVSTACVADPTAAPQGEGRGDVHGQDDRVDWHQAPRQWQDIAQQSIVSFMGEHRLADYLDGAYETLADVGLCADERFAHQPLLAFGSGYLVGRQTVATAGTVWQRTLCTEDCDSSDPKQREACMERRDAIVFGPRYDSYTSLAAIDEDDIYYCDALIGGSTDSVDDWAVIRLDRPVSADKQPVRVRSRAVEQGEGLVMISHSSGLPVKVDDGGEVLAVSGYLFTASLDGAAGSWGGAVFDHAGLLVGHQVGDHEDYAWSERDGCYRIRSTSPHATTAGNLVRRSSFLTPTD